MNNNPRTAAEMVSAQLDVIEWPESVGVLWAQLCEVGGRAAAGMETRTRTMTARPREGDDSRRENGLGASRTAACSEFVWRPGGRDGCDGGSGLGCRVITAHD